MLTCKPFLDSRVFNMQHHRVSTPQPSQCVCRTHISLILASRPAQRSHVTASTTGRVPAFCAAGFCASLIAAGSVIAAEADAQCALCDAKTHFSAPQASQPVLHLQPGAQAAPPTAPEEASESTPAFDAILLRIVHATDDLSSAAGGLLELTAAADPSLLNTTELVSKGSTHLQLTPAVSVPSSSSSSQKNVSQLLSPPPQGMTIKASGAPSPQQHAPSAAHSMSKQALAVAAEALKLATLLEAQSEGCEPEDLELLQQIAAAARLVSITAADIVRPVDGDVFPTETPAAAAAAASRAAPETADTDSMSSSAGLGAEVHSSAESPAVSVEAGLITCSTLADSTQQVDICPQM